MEIERPYTVAEVAKLTRWSRRTIVRMFQHEAASWSFANRTASGAHFGFPEPCIYGWSENWPSADRRIWAVLGGFHNL